MNIIKIIAVFPFGNTIGKQEGPCLPKYEYEDLNNFRLNGYLLLINHYTEKLILLFILCCL